MSDDVILKSLPRGAAPDLLERVRSGGSPAALGSLLQSVERDAAGIPIAAFDALMSRFSADATSRWPERTKSDAWLAPRVHWALRLTRREASDRGVWSYLANVICPEYARWRWAGKHDEVAANRWDGPHHKQAIARLWWGAELFRNGSDYRPVGSLFANQDFPNSYIHRVFVRARPLALGLVDAVVMASGHTGPTSDQINDVARKVNLCTAAFSIEAATGYHRDDIGAYEAWVRRPPGADADFDPMPTGPDGGGVPPGSLGRATAIGADICALADIGI